MNKKILLFITVLVLIASACTTYQYPERNDSNDSVTGGVVDVPDEGANETADEGEVPSEEENPAEETNETAAEGSEEVPAEEGEEPQEGAEQTPAEEEAEADIVAYEGDLIDLKPIVSDPDGDDVALGFTAPFNEEGVWQTEDGDAGYYSVIVTATDNKESFVTKQMSVKVLIKNKPPVIEIVDTLEYNESDLIVLMPQVTDEDNEEVFVTYQGWMTSKTYQTTYEDAGEHEVTVIADDGENRVSKDIAIIVRDVNRQPEISLSVDEKISVTEGETVDLGASGSDPDGEDVELTYSEPFTEEGTWQTQKGDAGTYKATVTASDGTNQVSKEVEIEVVKQNEPPVIESVSVIPEEVVLKKPGDTVEIRINVVASDPDGDNVEISYSGYMDSATRAVEYGEKGGTKTVVVTASDGKDTVSQEVSFVMNNWPCFDCQ